ncbi:ankyrin repeat domain-containing protein [Nocardioides sp. Y6]|uniref:Ankyrin repeat domain-containing protein n=1 Tax=Nocardioides malaquae TaxID=2773426 RepID=A0ABR9RVK5_9ACTN|nr:ankyrin repeat domain-containing protein [Nocardioides malaquae]MBE7325587.1 ankyrin repeat domain-containing protein [Nocardioides malaquae]
MNLTDEQVARVLALALDLARAGETEQLAEFLDHGLPVDATSESGDSLLMLAAYHDHPDTVDMLIGRGADPDLRNARDQSIVAGALFKGADDVVRRLVAAGADLDAGTPTARQAAEMFGRGGLLD